MIKSFAMEAKLLRTIDPTRFCVMLCATRAVVCVKCEDIDKSLFGSLCKVSPYSPLDVLVTLGDYEISKGVFNNSEIQIKGNLKAGSELTKYRKICV